MNGLIFGDVRLCSLEGAGRKVALVIDGVLLRK